MQEINWIDESFDVKKSTDYHLTMQIGLDGLSFCIIDTVRYKYLFFKHHPFIVGKLQFLARKIEAILDQEEVFNNKFKNVSINYSTHKSTLVPNEYAESEHIQPIALLTNNIGRNEELRTDLIPNFDYQVVYSCPKELTQALQRKFTNICIRHKSVALISSANEQRNEKKNSMAINFEKKYIRLVAFKENKIELYNSFFYKNEADFLYYTLNVWQNLQFDPEHDEIIISGHIDTKSNYIKNLSKYIRRVKLLRPMPGFHYSTLFEKIKDHQFTSLLNTYPCAL